MEHALDAQNPHEDHALESGCRPLRELRERLGLTLRQVQTATEKLAAKHQNPAFVVHKARLSEFESKGILPNIYRLYALSAVYGRDISELLGMYGLDISRLPADSAEFGCRPSCRLGSAASHAFADHLPSVAIKTCSTLNAITARWGPLTAMFIGAAEDAPYTFGYIGTEDRSMFPLLLPGSFVQIDESKRRVVERQWSSQYERPIFFVETRDGFACSWCSVEGTNLVLWPHPLSAVPVRRYRNGSEAEVIGQVVGVAMRLDQFALSPSYPANG